MNRSAVHNALGIYSERNLGQYPEQQQQNLFSAQSTPQVFKAPAASGANGQPSSHISLKINDLSVVGREIINSQAKAKQHHGASRSEATPLAND